MKNKGDLYLIRTKLLVYRRQKRVRTEGFSTDSWDKKDFLFNEQNHRLNLFFVVQTDTHVFLNDWQLKFDGF